MNPEVSVVMSVFNRPLELKDSVESVLEQRYENFELIVVNDGSTDSQVTAYLNELKATEPRVRIVNQANLGLTQALICGCDLARGQYIARIDVGDQMSPSRLEMQANIFNEFLNCAFVSSWTRYYGPNWEPISIQKEPVFGTPQPVIQRGDLGLSQNIPMHGSVAFRKTAYLAAGGYRKEFYYGQDWDLWYRLAEIGDYFVIPEVLYKARYFPNAISTTKAQHQREIAKYSFEAHVARKKKQPEIEILESAATIRPKGESFERSITRKQLADGNYYIGQLMRNAGHVTCRNYFKAALQAYPFHLKSAFRYIQSMFLR